MLRDNVIFICTGNSIRSQIAEAFLRNYAKDKFNVFSAGLNPKPIHSLTYQVMEEVGISIDDQKSTGLDKIIGKRGFKYAIIVCHEAEKNCPDIYPWCKVRLFWPFEDPGSFKGRSEEHTSELQSH